MPRGDSCYLRTMDSDVDQDWVWRGRHLRPPLTFREEISGDLQAILRPTSVGPREYWEIPGRSPFLHRERKAIASYFNLSEFSLKERVLRRLFLIMPINCGVYFLFPNFRYFGLFLVALLSIICLILLYKHRFVLQTLIIGVAGMSLAVPLVGFDFWPLPAFMVLTLVLYLIARRRAQSANQ
jgi:hypothetical protein